MLLTRLDIAAAAQYTNIFNTFTELLKLGVVPIVNENDTVATVRARPGWFGARSVSPIKSAFYGVFV